MSVRCQTTEQRLSLLAALLSSDSLHLVPKTISPFHSVARSRSPPFSSLSFHPAHIQFLHNASVSLKSDSADPPLAECSSGRTLALQPSACLSTYSLSLRIATKKCQTHPRLSVSPPSHLALELGSVSANHSHCCSARGQLTQSERDSHSTITRTDKRTIKAIKLIG